MQTVLSFIQASVSLLVSIISSDWRIIASGNKLTISDSLDHLQI